jgi:Asp-tRNA(Asn)/Glu-tRNA(Gln) amidotransferase A subunit family amidase
MTQLQAQIGAARRVGPRSLCCRVKRGQILNTQYPCVVEELGLAPSQEGPLAGIALAQKDIFFNAHDRLPGCGVGLGQKKSGLDPAAAVSALEKAGAEPAGLRLSWRPTLVAQHLKAPHFARCINPTDPRGCCGRFFQRLGRGRWQPSN